MRLFGMGQRYAAVPAAVLLLALTSCYPPPPPGPPPPGPPPPSAIAPPPSYAAPPPSYAAPAPPPRIAYRRCAPGWHLVRGHYNRFGQWIRPHCRPNRY